MKLGLFTMNALACADPETAKSVAQAAEAGGFESLWAGEHPVMPTEPFGREPLRPKDPIMDPLVTMGFLAGVTSTIRLATGVVILPLRNPLILAKEISSLDVLSRGRFTFGFGVGWLEPEFEAFGIPFEQRGARADDYLRAMIELWTAENPVFEGPYARFASVQSKPGPRTKPYPPVVVGGSSKAALRRALSQGHGWFGGLLMDDETVRAQIAELGRLSEELERPAHLGPLEITVSVKGALDERRVESLAALGVDRLVIVPRPGYEGDRLVEWVTSLAHQLSEVATARR